MELKPIRTNEQEFRGNYQAAEEVVRPSEGQKVLHNTYLLLAATMVPTVVGAFIGMQFAGVMTASPILTFFIMLGAVIGLQFGIREEWPVFMGLSRNSIASQVTREGLGSIVGKVGSTMKEAIYPAVIEFGRRPRAPRPPPRAPGSPGPPF